MHTLEYNAQNQMVASQNQACGIGSSYQQLQNCYPYYQYQYPSVTYQFIQTAAPVQDFSVRKVEGGWIVVKDNKEHVITDPKEILKFLKKD